MPEPEPLEFSEVVNRGRLLIEDIVSNISKVVPLAAARTAYWHPTGFIVLNLQDVDGLGLVRLHIWSRDRRTKRRGNPETHSHVFHLTSFVLKGKYVEHQFREVPSETGEFFGYQVIPPTGDGIDRVVPDGSRCDLDLVAVEETDAGKFHNLPAGVFHRTEIQEGETCATIALLSRPQPGMLDRLVGPENHSGIEGERLPVDRRTLAAALLEIGIKI
ncbi:MAG: hypothetical protein LCH43_03125 [Actinobacteria bacterium]|nr:hypothetical protein [Actinomycetota bacterium]